MWLRIIHIRLLVDVPKQSAITSDNVTLSIDGVLYLKIINAYDASYGVEDPGGLMSTMVISYYGI